MLKRLLIALLVAALFGNLTLLFLDPLTLMLRTLSASISPASILRCRQAWHQFRTRISSWDII